MMVLDKYRTIPREGLFLKREEAAYIAGFFDGDGSVRIQLQPRKRSRFGFRVRTIISFAQKIGHEEELKWYGKSSVSAILNKKDPDVLAVAKISDSLSGINYATTKKKYTAKEVAEFLKRYTPVTT